MKGRVVLLLSTFPRLSETFIVNKFLGLLNAGWDVHIVSAYNDSKAWQQLPNLLDYKDIHKRVHYNWRFRPFWLTGLLYPFALLFCLLKNFAGTVRYFSRSFKRIGWKAIKRFYMDFPIIALNPKLIHYEFGATAVNRSDLGYYLDCKQIVSFRGYDLNFSGLDKPGYYDEVWQNISAAHFLGNDLWQRAQKRGCPRDLPHVFIPPALDMTKFTKFNTKPIEPVGSLTRPARILSVGRLEWKKGYDFALQAVKLLIAKGYVIEYRIVGEGEYKNALYFARHQLGLEGEVELLGALTHEEVLKQLAWADMFLHASVSEGFCNAVLEAQAAGLPVVCSDADGLSENVANGVTGYVVHRRSPSDLAEKLIFLVQDDRLRESMGSAGRSRVAQFFQMQSHITAWENFYHQLL